jgi:acyl-CoA synthetase (AMP-forming)/AMP-acid ligase II
LQLFTHLDSVWRDSSDPFLVGVESPLAFSDVKKSSIGHLSQIKRGDVVAVIGDFDSVSISNLLFLIDLGAIVVPLSPQTRNDHEYFFESALVDKVVEGTTVTSRRHDKAHELIEYLRSEGDGGLVLFSTGTTGRPKAILHNMTKFLKRFETPRPALRTINFLMFDHIGGINTLLHTLFNRGVVVATKSRSVEDVLEAIGKFEVEVLPTTPTFLRMILISGLVPDSISGSLKVITYGTERMDQVTLSELASHLPWVDFRQTFGMSELGILRVKSKSRDSLFMKIGGEGVVTRIVDGILEIKSDTRMLGYLNAESPFDADGWYTTHDKVEQHGDFIKVVGRDTEVINVGGLKFMASEVELACLEYPGIDMVSVTSAPNPITGQHCELLIQTSELNFDVDSFKVFLRTRLPSHMQPRRVKLGSVLVGHRFKRS